MSSWQRFASVLLLVLGSAGLAVPAHADDSFGRVVSIAHARTLPLGTVVTVNGTATTPSGAFESSFFDKGFGLQDRSAGIYVSIQDDPHITTRDQVRVTGTLRDSFGLLILVPADPTMVKVHGNGPRIRPAPRATGAINENSEGRLVRVVAAITQAPVSDLPFGSKFFVNDGSGELTIFINVQTNINLTNLSVGQIVSVTGFSSQFDTHYEIDPRFPADIIVLSRSADVGGLA
jgi:DNA/RNA endonuclease YhcR with UshA esterase domain